MLDRILGLGAFGMFLLYDWNRVLLKKQWTSHLFVAGNVCLAVVAVRLVQLSQTVRFGGWLLWPTGAAVSLALLIHTLHFALPFDSTYYKEADLHTVCRSGMYGWCRYPGIWWLFGCSLCLGMSASPGEWVIPRLVLSFLNLLYAWYQDHYTSAAEFSDYEDYKRAVPSLVPNFIQNNKRR